MRITTLKLSNFRSFSEIGPIAFDQINILVGANNAGKSSILRSIYLMQDGSGQPYADIRVGSTSAIAEFELADAPDNIVNWGDPSSGSPVVRFIMNINSDDRKRGTYNISLIRQNGVTSSGGILSSVEPNHFIVPFLSKRKTISYQEDVRNQNALQNIPNLGYLSAKLSRIANPAFPGSDAYREACEAILGFVVTAVPSDNGQRPGIYLPNKETVYIDQMGEGVPNIVGLLADLAISEGKLFLIEELENDLHPTALKALLDYIIKSSEKNQFIVSTHSNIVLRHLGSVDNCKIYRVDAQHRVLPTEATITLVGTTPKTRLAVLRDLGYALSDLELWDGWLILEESSAERIIRDYLIPWFAPKLSRLRTLSAGGVTKVRPTFDDFNRLVRFAHLEAIYRGTTWVRVDGDDTGNSVVQQLRDKYPTWKEEQFGSFSQRQFEEYYPYHFKENVTKALGISNKSEKREAKKLLLDEVLAWLDEDSERGMTSLGESALEIINDLKRMEAAIIGV